MIKKLLPAMIGATLAGGMTAAAADVTVFGHLDQSVLRWDAEASASSATTGGVSSTSTSGDDANLRCTTCSIGFKGSEDLGNGLNAIFKLDFQFDMNNRNRGAITDRDQWVGLGGGFGKVRIGTISTVYKSHGAMIDPMYRTVLQARDIGLQSSLHSGAGEEGQARATNTFRYDSPDFNGLKIGAHYTLDSDESPEDDNPYGIGASYQNGGILAFADYITNDGTRTTGNELSAWKVGGKYSMNNFSVFGQYESIENDGTDFASDITFNVGFLTSISGLSRSDLVGSFASVTDPYDSETDVWHIGGTYTMGNNMLYLAYGQSDGDIKDVSSSYAVTDERTHFTIAAIHSLSKRTKVYAGYSMVEWEFEDNATVASDGFSVSADAEFDALTLGVKHKF